MLKGAYFSIYHEEKFPFEAPYGGAYRNAVIGALNKMKKAGLNYLMWFIPIPRTVRKPYKGNAAGQPFEEWANFTFLDNLVALLDDCYDLGICVELDLADNRWIPFSIRPQEHIGKPDGLWPVAGEEPWKDSIEWYTAIIDYVEKSVRNVETIAMWCMTGNFQLGGSEPVVWDGEGQPDIVNASERYVKECWPLFRATGKRPKGSPYMMPIFVNGGYWVGPPERGKFIEDTYWADKTPTCRLSSFSNIKKWLADDLNIPPDYWMMSSYAYCDPARDGVNYMKEITGILGGTAPIITTDLKCVPGHEYELINSLVYRPDMNFTDMMRWHLEKCEEYGFAGWWIWALQDSEDHPWGVIDKNGVIRQEFMDAFI